MVTWRMFLVIWAETSWKLLHVCILGGMCVHVLPTFQKNNICLIKFTYKTVEFKASNTLISLRLQLVQAHVYLISIFVYTVFICVCV